MKRSLIVAISQNGVIGVDNDMPWKRTLSEDLQRFKRLTMGHHLIMGRKTFQSIGRALPGRVTIVLTRTGGFTYQGRDAAVIPAMSLQAALNAAEIAEETEVFICGGAEVYKTALALDVVDRVYLTLVMRDYEGDTKLDLQLSPDAGWYVASDECHMGANVELPYRFQTIERAR